ncbi:hypothetical protein J6590_040493 [Homalodisca vitripennis]|nr:hypothetical protein J6590_040493 [Homalodisca vitripennis]
MHGDSGLFIAFPLESDRTNVCSNDQQGQCIVMREKSNGYICINEHQGKCSSMTGTKPSQISSNDEQGRSLIVHWNLDWSRSPLTVSKDGISQFVGTRRDLDLHKRPARIMSVNG